MNENKRKTFGTIFGIILFICCILFVTYAWYVWRSEYININANIAEETSDVNFSPDTMEVNASDIGPILDYTDSDYYTEANKGKYLAYADFSAENKSSDTFYINAILEITSISDSLKVDSFKYVLLRKNTSNGVYSQIISEGDFSNFIVGNNTILLTEIGSKDTYYYRFVVYIDGTMNNSNDMMNGSLKSFLQLSASKNPVNVTFDVNSGSNWTSSTCTFYLDGTTCSKSVVKDETYGEMPIPVKTGYNFDGWYTSASGGDKVDETTVVTSNTAHILYAHWTSNTYNISYSLNNGLSGSNAPTSATYDASVNISNPTKSISIVGNANSTGASVGSNTSASYTFSGWTASNLNTSTAKYGTSSSNITTSWNNASTKVTAQYFKNLTSTANATVTLTANWTKPSTVTLPTLSKTGYTCNWYDNSSGTGTAYKSGGTYTLTSSDDGLTSKTFYANCVSSAESYAVTFNVNSGNNWTSSTCSTSDGFSLSGTTCSKSVVKDETYGEMPIPVKTGYNFDGWYTSASGGDKVDETTVVTSNTAHILYAHWTSNTYNISYSLNNGLSGSNAPTSATYDASVNISNPTKSISIVGNANSTGASVGSNTSASYTFSGWTASNLNTSTAKYGTSSSNITTSWNNASTKVTAQYFKNLTSTANATVTLTANWTKPSTVTLPTLSKTGYTCNWYDNSSGTGTAYKSGGTYTLTSSDDGLTSKTFYANCVSSAESYAVTFNVNSGNNWTSSTCSTSDGFSLSGTTCSKTVTSDSTYGDLPTPVRSSSGSTYLTTNYVFDGWYDASSGGNQILSSSLVEITSDVQLYAHWLSYYSYSNYSTITFDVNNGNAWTSDTCKTGDGFLFNSSTSACTKAISSSTATTVNAFPTPTRSGYVFSGWYSATSGGTEYVVPYTTTRTNYTYASLTMYAQWEAGTMVSALSLEDDSTYTITYDANGGDATSVPEPQTKTYGVNLTLSTTVPTYSGYTFLGWSTDSKATSATYEPGGIYSSNADATLYAVWQND